MAVEPSPNFQEAPENMQIMGLNEFMKDEENVQEVMKRKQRLSETQRRDSLRKISIHSNEKKHTISSRSQKREYWEMTPEEEQYYEEKILRRYLERKTFFYKV